LRLNINPCLNCGACCAYYRASFYWAEADETRPDAVPSDLTEKLNDFLLFMRGTHQSSPRCIALQGTIGVEVCCGIYPRRPSTCRNLEPSWATNAPNPHCDKARQAWGLQPLQPDSWFNPTDFPKAA
jgi:uncharacterized protein